MQEDGGTHQLSQARRKLEREANRMQVVSTLLSEWKIGTKHRRHAPRRRAAPRWKAEKVEVRELSEA